MPDLKLFPICPPDPDPMLERVIAERCGHLDERRNIQHDFCGLCLRDTCVAWALANPGVTRSVWNYLMVKLSPHLRHRPGKPHPEGAQS